jgi:hypothetical protein
MNGKTLGLLAVVTMAGSMAANAQTETLVFSDGSFSGDVILSAALPRNGHDISVSPTEFSFPGIGWGVGLNTICPSCGYSLLDMWETGDATFSFSTRHGHITAWDIDIDFTNTPGTASPTMLYATISNQGVSYTQTSSGLACSAPPGQPDSCQPATGGTSQRGHWTIERAPEIDPASAASGLSLLFGGLAVLRGRRRVSLNAGQ